MPRLAKVVNVLAIQQVKQGTETTGFRIGFTLHSCQYVSSRFNISSIGEGGGGANTKVPDMYTVGHKAILGQNLSFS